MEIKLNLEQISYLKSLDSKKKKRKFILDCLIENVELFEEYNKLLSNQFQFNGKYFKAQNYSPEEIELVKHNINQREISKQGSELLKSKEKSSDDFFKEIDYKLTFFKSDLKKVVSDFETKHNGLKVLIDIDKIGCLVEKKLFDEFNEIAK